MGWFGGGKKKTEKDVAVEQYSEKAATIDGEETSIATSLKGESVEIFRREPAAPLPVDVSVFEFGTAGTSEGEKLTLAGYCPVSDEMEPCRWEVFPAGQAEAPGFRILF